MMIRSSLAWSMVSVLVALVVGVLVRWRRRHED
jgi:MYXO-CTERM domain-containing protein